MSREEPKPAVVVVAVGLSAAKKLIETFDGEALYFPKVESVIRMDRDRRIYREFIRFKYKELAKKHNLTNRHVQHIVKEHRKVSPKTSVHQRDLF